MTGAGEPERATDDTTRLAQSVLDALVSAGATLACAESLTGGLISATITRLPGASEALRGGVVAYATDLKTTLLGVDPGLLAVHGAVHPDVAAAMATGARARLGATYAVATTGVAGPDTQDGAAVGTVHVAVAGPTRCTVESYSFTGVRGQIRRRSVDAALTLLAAEIADADRARAEEREAPSGAAGWQEAWRGAASRQPPSATRGSDKHPTYGPGTVDS